MTAKLPMLSLVFAAALASQLPANSQKSEAPSEHRTQQTAADQRGTQQVPFVVQVVRSGHEKVEAESEKQDRDKQAITEKKLADYTWDLALATLALVLVAIAQAFLFVWQLMYMRKGAHDTAEAATAATKQAKIAQDTFAKLERPYLYITIDTRFRIDDYDSPYVSYGVSNHGRIPAEIKEVYIHNGKSVNFDPAKDALLIGLEEELFANRIFGPGEVRKNIKSEPACDETLKWKGVMDGPDDGPYVGKYPLLAPNEGYFFYVQIVYDGPFTRDHVARACWRMVDQTFQIWGGLPYNFTE